MAIPLRTDYAAEPLRAAAKASKDAAQARRLLALASIYNGASRTEAARVGAVTVQIVRDWVVKFNAHGPAGLIDRKPPGQPSRLTDADRAAVAAAVESRPMPAIHGVVRWRVDDGDLLGQLVVVTDVAAVCCFVGIALVELPHVFRKPLVGIADDLGQGDLGEVAILAVDRLDPGAVHGEQLAPEQVKLPAQQHEFPEHLAEGRAVVAAKVGDGLEVQPEVPQ